MAVIALDLGGTKIASAIIDNDGNIRYKHKNLLSGRKGHDVGKLIIENINRQLEKAAYLKIPIEAIGLCVPGSVNPDTKRVWAPNIPEWENYPIAEEIKQHISNRSICRQRPQLRHLRRTLARRRARLQKLHLRGGGHRNRCRNSD